MGDYKNLAMYKIKLVVVGKLKEQFHIAEQEEYLKRLSKYVQINLIEIKDKKIPENASEKEEQNVKYSETAEIFKHINKDDYVILLDLYGKEYDSVEFSSWLKNNLDTKQNLTFVIAGSLGYDELAYKIAKEKVKLSRLTFTHQMTRIILLEQIYRSFKIINNETYHK